MLMLSRTWLDIWAHWNLEVMPADSSKSGRNQREVQRERRFNGSGAESRSCEKRLALCKDVSRTRAADWRLAFPHLDSAHRPAIVCEAGLLSPAAGFLMENDG